jgi:hypothetical protein
VTTTHLHLQTVVTHWQDLEDLRTTRPGDPWPPASLNRYLRTLDEYDPADGNSPLRLHVVDTIRAVESSLLTVADQVASSIQRPAVSRVRSAGAGDVVGLRLATAALADAVDPSRWRYTQHPTRTAPYAAVWLQHRVAGAPGPFRPLGALLLDRIATVAETAAQRVEHALGLSRRVQPIGRTCACSGELVLEGGDGRPPVVRCAGCGRTWAAAWDAA